MDLFPLAELDTGRIDPELACAWVGPQAVLEKLFMRLGSEWKGFTLTVRTLALGDFCPIAQM